MLNVNIKNISISIQGSFSKLLSGISFSIPPNSVFTILGRNGSGKSTLVKALTGLLNKGFYKVDGKVEWKEKNLLAIKSDELLQIRKNEIRYVFQDALNSLDPLKKIKYYFTNNHSSIEKADLLLNEFKLPGYKQISEMHSYELSGGMLQRLNFVLALAVEPQLIILDEPTSAIDSENTLIAMKAVKKFVEQKNNSALIVTQDILFAEKVSDKIAFLENGRLTEFISTADFLKSGDHRIKNFLDAHKELNK